MYHWDRVLAPCSWAALHALEQNPAGVLRTDLDFAFGVRPLIDHALAKREGTMVIATALGIAVAEHFKPTKTGELVKVA